MGKDQTRAPFVATNAIDDEDNILARVENLAALIKDSFVTGDWGEEDAEKLLQEDDELHGDFEDLEKEFDDDLEDEENDNSEDEDPETDAMEVEESQEDEK